MWFLSQLHSLACTLEFLSEAKHVQLYHDRKWNGAESEEHGVLSGVWICHDPGSSSQYHIAVHIASLPQPQVPQCRLHGQPGNFRPAARHLFAHEGLLLRHRNLATGRNGVHLDHNAPPQQHPVQLHLYHLHLRGPPDGCGLSSEVTASSKLLQRLESCCACLAVCVTGEHPGECVLFKIFKGLQRMYLF